MAQKPKGSTKPPKNVKEFVEYLKRTLGLDEEDPVMRKLREAKTPGEAQRIVTESGVSQERAGSTAQEREARATSERSGGWGAAQAAAAARAGRYQDRSQRPYSGAGPTTGGGRGGGRPSTAVPTTPIVANPSTPVDPRLPQARPTTSYTPFTPNTPSGPSTPNSYIPGGRVHYTTGGGSAAGKASVPQKAYEAYKSAKSSGQPYESGRSYTPFTPNPNTRTPSTNQPYSGFHSAPYRLTSQTGQGFTSERYNNTTRPTPVPVTEIRGQPYNNRSGAGYDPSAGSGMSPGPTDRVRSVPTTSFSTGANYPSPVTGRPAAGRTGLQGVVQNPQATGALQQAQHKYQSAIKDTDYGYGYGGYGSRDYSGSGYGDTGAISTRIMNDLQRDYNITREQAAGAVGNLAHESGGFRTYQEGNKTGPTGGVGWAQWTNSGGYDRRDAFEAYAKEKNLDPRSYEANYGFMKHELDGKYSGTISKLRGAKTVEEATKVFELNYEGAGVKNYGSRYNYANNAYGGYAPSSASNFDNNIARLQEQLNANGASLAVDGIMGPKTQEAQRKFGTSYTPFTPSTEAVPTGGSIFGRVKSGITSGIKNVVGAVPGALRQVGNVANRGAAFASYGGSGLGSESRGSVASYGGGGGGGGYRGGTYGGSGGSRISEGVGGAYKNR